MLSVGGTPPISEKEELASGAESLDEKIAGLGYRCAEFLRDAILESRALEKTSRNVCGVHCKVLAISINPDRDE
jgi:hypothetical protein